MHQAQSGVEWGRRQGLASPWLPAVLSPADLTCLPARLHPADAKFTPHLPCTLPDRRVSGHWDSVGAAGGGRRRHRCRTGGAQPRGRRGGEVPGLLRPAERNWWVHSHGCNRGGTQREACRLWAARPPWGCPPGWAGCSRRAAELCRSCLCPGLKCPHHSNRSYVTPQSVRKQNWLCTRHRQRRKGAIYFSLPLTTLTAAASNSLLHMHSTQTPTAITRSPTGCSPVHSACAACRRHRPCRRRRQLAAAARAASGS